LESWTAVLQVAAAVAWGWGALSVAWAAVLETGAAVLEVSAHSHCARYEGVVWMGLVLGLVLLSGMVVECE
jgi:hypothetical protein